MKVEVRYFTFLREITRRRAEIIEIEDDLRIEELLNTVCKMYGKEFEEILFKEKGHLADAVKVLINGSNIWRSEGLSTTLKEGDIVQLLPPIGGG